MDRESPFGLKPEQLTRLLAIAEADAARGEDVKAGAANKASVPQDIGEAKLPGWIGRYKTLQVLGEGGMGIVYLARQEHPIERTVAVKLIKPGMDSRQVIARFEVERQTLALLDHPHIAHVLDAGTTEDGRPYFVMEYVQGLSITEHCDRQKLPIEERLRLFLQVCEAIQHAHSQGIIHRDIKPSNILISLVNGKAIPKVIDFGIAKALAQPTAERTFRTADGLLVGTPEFVSPEQADLRDKDVDVRSDVYSLGVVLYVLLTGVLPYDVEAFRDGGIEQMRRTIREEDPKSPSLRLSALGEDAVRIAEDRRTDVPAMTKTLQTGLEQIPLKAMQKERNLRYQSVAELARDVEHHLSGVSPAPVLPSPSPGLVTFIRRHPVSITSVVIVIAALLVGLYLGRIIDLGTEPASNLSDGQRPRVGKPSPGGSGGSGLARPSPIVYYVDAGAQGTEDGVSWRNAFRNVQDALRTARAGDEIRVAQGTYKPDEGRAIKPAGREASFKLLSGVAMYGGFPARGGDWDRRNPTLYETILSGDLGVAGNDGDNSYHVVVASGTNAKTILDGFTITRGNADGEGENFVGGGMYNVSGHLTVVDCLFARNAGDRAGAVFNRFSDAKFYNCRFIANTCTIDAAGMVNRASNTILSHCLFADNVAGRNCGGMLAFDGGKPSVINCRFEGNSAASAGGGVHNEGSESVFVGCIFAGNTSVAGGGGLYNTDCNEPVHLINCTFSGNSSTSNEGGAIYDKNSPLILVNCILWGNHARSGRQLAAYAASDVEIRHCCVQGGQSEVVVMGSVLNWGLGNIAADPRFVDADGPDGAAGTDDDLLDLSADSPCIDAGDDREIPADAADLDADGDTQEPIPFDIAGRPRIADDMSVADAGVADPPRCPAIVDIGACERSQ